MMMVTGIGHFTSSLSTAQHGNLGFWVADGVAPAISCSDSRVSGGHPLLGPSYMAFNVSLAVVSSYRTIRGLERPFEAKSIEESIAVGSFDNENTLAITGLRR